MSVATDQDTDQRPLALAGHNEEAGSPESTSVTVERNGRSNKRLFWSILSLIIFAILTVIIWIRWDQVQLFITFITDQEAFGAYLQSFGLWGPIVLLVAQLLQVFLAFVPGHVVLIAAGYVYGFFLGLLFNITFTVLASQLAYLFARWAGRPVIYRLADRKTIDYWERLSNQKGVLFFTIAFLLPVFPSDAMNFVGGLSGIDSRRFLLASFLGRFPSAVTLTLVGAYGLDFSNFEWIMVLVAYILFFVIGYFIVNRLKRTLDLDNEPLPGQK